MQTDRLTAFPARAAPYSAKKAENDQDPLMIQAKALEASFLAEMLGLAGLGTGRESFGGGIGEEQFSSFLRDEEARAMVAHGGIGLAEQLFRSMRKDTAP